MEKLMQYVWQYRLWPVRAMRTVDGRRISVIDPGLLNNNSGPDFFNAKVVVGDEMWVGNVEIHVRASDWYRHGHDGDHAYDTVILHVVAVDDRRIQRPDGSEIPQLVMDCAPDFSERYNAMVNNPLHDLKCASELQQTPSIYISDWINALAYERLYDKSDRILALLKRYDGGWRDVIYVTLARALGFGANAQPMEQLALSTPLKYMLRHSDNSDLVEAILFGQSGLADSLATDARDLYQERLLSDYAFMARKYGLHRQPIEWKMRMRPANMPHRRIATLARLLCKTAVMTNSIFEVSSEEEAQQLFDVNLMGYWASRYTFNGASDSNAVSRRALSTDSVRLLIINVVVPLTFAYGLSTGDTEYCDRAVELLQSLKPEQNTIITLFRNAGITVGDAFTSQALIQLRRNYCEPRKCLFCRLGHRYLAAKVPR